MTNELPYLHDVSSCRASLLASLNSGEQNTLIAQLRSFKKISNATNAFDMVKVLSIYQEFNTSTTLASLFTKNSDLLPERWRSNPEMQRSILRMAAARDEASLTCEILNSYNDPKWIAETEGKLKKIQAFRQMLETKGNPIAEGNILPR